MTEAGDKVLLNENNVEACGLLTKTGRVQAEFTAAVSASAEHESGTPDDLLEKMNNRKADSYVTFKVKMEDYYRIKDNADAGGNTEVTGHE